MDERSITFFDSTLNLTLFKNYLIFSSPYDVIYDHNIAETPLSRYGTSDIDSVKEQRLHRDLYHVYDMRYEFCNRLLLKVEPYKKSHNRSLSAKFTYPLLLIRNLDFIYLPNSQPLNGQGIHEIYLEYPEDHMATKQYEETVNMLSRLIPIREELGVMI